MRVVDPRFAAALRRLRTERGMSLRDLAKASFIGKSTVSELENGRMRPSADMAAHLDDVLGADGVLARMVIQSAVADEHAARLSDVTARQSRVDGATVAALAAVLAAQRHLDDVVDPHMIVSSTAVQCSAVEALAKDATGPYAVEVRRLAAEWTQFLGWLYAQTRLDAQAVETLRRAVAMADEIGDGTLSSQAKNYRGYVERRRQNPRGIARHFQAAYETPGAGDLHRADSAIQAAQGMAMLGEISAATQMINTAEDLIASSERDEAAPSTYWLTPTWLQFPLGLVHHALGNDLDAVDNLRSGLDALPDEWMAAGWSSEYRRTLLLAEQAA
ncbi:helix-turn-helix domain-containing protein [Promicromonospora kroppenstedtii]|uniref:helix-turn-helix domain-containing protein n=1 Tax=Promicromonospora kroppenstedtii TaxID=440482 RepID=UPI0012FCE6E5|nr:helix-turn-helix transcriptional regulator [Promicromonospora kroppenstedtii]